LTYSPHACWSSSTNVDPGIVVINAGKRTYKVTKTRFIKVIKTFVNVDKTLHIEKNGALSY